MSSTHTAIATVSKGHFDAIQVPTELPGDGEVLIKVEYGSMIAFDTYVTDRGFYVQQYPLVLGFSGAGTVAKLGAGVQGLKIGDRVTAFGYGASRNKSLQEYSIQPVEVVGKIPDSLSLAEASTIPDNFVTAFYTLFNQLGLPHPDSFPATVSPPLADTPILIYGAGSTAGIYAIQLLNLAGYKQIIATASKKHHEYLRSLGATHTFDYNSPALVEDVGKVVGGDGKVTLILDCITAESTVELLSKIASPHGKVALLLPVKQGNTVTNDKNHALWIDYTAEQSPFVKGTTVIGVKTFNYRQDEYLSKNLMPKILPSLLQSGSIKPSRVRLLDQGSLKERVEEGLELLRNNKISGEKVVVKIQP
ncbi:Trans-enoyl reductase himH [Psilocybe cubensis]|uniref:Enoyl reductase (ER) domain-containing protein n=2 Tax=Psilocybe cubensis TaxID=181762 RepID=A0A8H7YA22_PSICU|nr:Trans-enoyl reductase himH [Psilocybe cubensis]KAH9486431.1 Trans-enoyl reductase himH [Psilocybe cubensis]